MPAERGVTRRSKTQPPARRGRAWSGPDKAVSKYAAEQRDRCLSAYREEPGLVLEHANIERATAQGGYGRRQIYELVQNGADALIDHPGGRIHVLLNATSLYCAN